MEPAYALLVALAPLASSASVPALNKYITLYENKLAELPNVYVPAEYEIATEAQRSEYKLYEASLKVFCDELRKRKLDARVKKWENK